MMMMRLSFVLAVAAAANNNGTIEAARRAAIVGESAATIATLRAMLCGKVSNASAPLLVAAVGRDASQLTQRVEAKLAQSMRVAGAAAARKALRRAAETTNFDFRRFDDYDAVVGPAVLAHWQELLATYPRARLAVVLGNAHTPPSKVASRARLSRCARADAAEAGELLAAYGSACPSTWQRAKVEDAAVAEMLENGRAEPWAPRGLEKIEAKSWRAFDAAGFFARTSKHALLVCPGQGGTATKTLAGALVDAKLARDHDGIAHYNGRVLQETAAAAEDDRFDWIGAHHRGSPASCARDVG